MLLVISLVVYMCNNNIHNGNVLYELLSLCCDIFD